MNLPYGILARSSVGPVPGCGRPRARGHGRAPLDTELCEVSVIANAQGGVCALTCLNPLLDSYRSKAGENDGNTAIDLTSEAMCGRESRRISAPVWRACLLGVPGMSEVSGKRLLSRRQVQMCASRGGLDPRPRPARGLAIYLLAARRPEGGPRRAP